MSSSSSPSAAAPPQPQPRGAPPGGFVPPTPGQLESALTSLAAAIASGSISETDEAHNGINRLVFGRPGSTPEEMSAATRRASAVPLPSSRRTERSLDVLAAAMEAASRSSDPLDLTLAFYVSGGIHAVSTCSPLRCAALSRHPRLFSALGAMTTAMLARGASGTAEEWLLESASLASQSIILQGCRPEAAATFWGTDGAFRVAEAMATVFARASSAASANLRGSKKLAADAVLMALQTCPDGAALRRRLLAVRGFAEALCADIGRGAAATAQAVRQAAAGSGAAPAGGNRLPFAQVPRIAAAFCGADFKARYDEASAGWTTKTASPNIPSPDAGAYSRMLVSAAPSLLDRLCDLFEAGRGWTQQAASSVGTGRMRRAVEDWAEESLLGCVAAAAFTAASSEVAARPQLVRRLLPALVEEAEAVSGLLRAVAGADPAALLAASPLGGSMVFDKLRSKALILDAATAIINALGDARAGGAHDTLSSIPEVGAGLLRLAEVRPLGLLDTEAAEGERVWAAAAAAALAAVAAATAAPAGSAAPAAAAQPAAAGAAAPAAAAAAAAGAADRTATSRQCATCGAARAKFQCECRGVRYCGGECQKAGWPAHKPTCAAFKKGAAGAASASAGGGGGGGGGVAGSKGTATA